MPKALERELKLEAIKKGFKSGSKRFGSYVFGTLAKIKKAKGGKW